MTVKYKLGSMFAGIGGTCLGFQQAGAEIVWANEVDHNASITYRHFWKGEYLQEADVTEVDKTTIPQLDILIGGFPCQAFSIAGYRKGFEDERGNMFFSNS
ncbi:DNA cytosine methyltransferase [Bacillus paranthracis]